MTESQPSAPFTAERNPRYNSHRSHAWQVYSRHYGEAIVTGLTYRQAVTEVRSMTARYPDGNPNPEPVVDNLALPCCGGIEAHRPTCANHRHTFDGPRNCAACRLTPRPSLTQHENDYTMDADALGPISDPTDTRDPQRVGEHYADCPTEAHTHEPWTDADTAELAAAMDDARWREAIRHSEARDGGHWYRWFLNNPLFADLPSARLDAAAFEMAVRREGQRAAGRASFAR